MMAAYSKISKIVKSLVLSIWKKENIVFVFLFCICLPYIAHYAENLAYSTVRTVDEYEILKVVKGLYYLLGAGEIKEFLVHTYGVVYGSPYFLLAVFEILPFFYVFNEPGLIVALRALSLMFGVGSFLLVYKILKSSLESKILRIVIVVLCFSMPVNFRFSTLVHPDTIYIFFLMVSFYLLIKDANRLSRLYYYAAISFVIALSIKLQSAVFGLFHIAYLLNNCKKLDLKFIMKLSGCISVALILCNLPFVLKPELFSRHLEFINLSKTIVKQGWHKAEVPPIDFGKFSRHYIDVYSFALLMTGCLFLFWQQFRKGAFKEIFVVTSFVVVLIYFLIQTIYIRIASMHYGLVMAYLIPVLIAYSLERIRAISQPNSKSYRLFPLLALSLIIMMNVSNLYGTATKLMNPAGSQYNKNVYNAIKKLEPFIENYDGELRRVGVAHDMGVPPKNGRRVNFHRFFTLEVDQISRYDLMIFWKKDSYYRHYVNVDQGWEKTKAIYLKIKNGEPFKYESQKFYFYKITEDDEFEIYKRIQPAL